MKDSLYKKMQEQEANSEREMFKLTRESEKMKGAHSTNNRPHKYWYEKPAGLILIAVVAGVAVYVLCEYLPHNFSNFFHSQTP